MIFDLVVLSASFVFTSGATLDRRAAILDLVGLRATSGVTSGATSVRRTAILKLGTSLTKIFELGRPQDSLGTTSTMMEVNHIRNDLEPQIRNLSS